MFSLYLFFKTCSRRNRKVFTERCTHSVTRLHQFNIRFYLSFLRLMNISNWKPVKRARSPFSLIQLNMTFPYFHFAYAFGTVIITTIKVGNNNNNNHNCQQRVAKTIFTHIYTPPSNIDARVFPFVLYMVYLFNGVYIYIILLFASSSIQ